MNKLEYLILKSALQDSETLPHIAFDLNIPRNEVAIAANRLFENGDILAGFFTEAEVVVRDVVLTMSQIQANLDGRLGGWYYVTPQGGASWEAVANPNWNQYYKRYSVFQPDGTIEFSELELICSDRKVIEQLLSISGYVDNEIPIPGTEVWDVIEDWQPMYWKTLPKAYKIRYKRQKIDCSISPNTPPEWFEANDQAHKLMWEIHDWYTEPEFEPTPPNLIDYLALDDETPPNKIRLEKVKYLILEFAVRSDEYSLASVAFYSKLSNIETAIAGDFLFQNGYIRARVFAEECDKEGAPNVVLTMAGIQDHLDGRLNVTYYLTPQGGARWETLANPDWNKFFIAESLDAPVEDGIIGTQKQIVEKLLNLDCFVGLYKHIPGTEIWTVLEPWQATYWKTLPRGYQVYYQSQPNYLYLNYLEESAPPELAESYEEARQWYQNIKKWYTDPSFD